MVDLYNARLGQNCTWLAQLCKSAKHFDWKFRSEAQVCWPKIWACGLHVMVADLVVIPGVETGVEPPEGVLDGRRGILEVPNRGVADLA